jgi:multidrug resistance efflux pump
VPQSAVDAAPTLRQDVIVAPDGETGRGRVVKDPRTRKFYRFGAVEGFLLERIDGRRSAVDLQIELASELGESLTLEEIQDFLDALRDRGLMETGSVALPACRPDLGRQVVGALEQGGFRFRRADDPVPAHVDPAQRNLEEARKFDEAVDRLHEGRFQAALRSFDELLAANPGNQRALALRSILVQAGTAAAANAAQSGREEPQRQNLLYYRIPFFNPDRLFDALHPLVRFVWSPAFFGAYLAIVAVAGWIFWQNAGGMLAQLPALGLHTLAGGLLVVAVLQTALHEFAHGLTCKHYGGRVPELGFLLILLFLPALYVDVSDAWLFRRRRQRVLVSLAGPLFDIGVAALAAIAWRLLAPGPGRSIAVLLMVASVVSVLLNLNPLIRLDGYYVLSDLSGIPNLRAAARRALVRGIRRMRGIGTTDATTLTPRARVFIGVYGVLSLLYVLMIFWMLGSILLGFSARLAGLWGPLALALGAGWLLRRPLGALVALVAARVRAARGRAVLRFAIVAGVIAGVAAVPWSLKVGGPATLESGTRAGVRPEVSGQLAEILVREGDTVEAGQLLARLDHSDLDARLAMVRSEIRQARAQLDLLRHGAQEEQIRQARERVRSAEVEVAQLRTRHERVSRLRDEGLVAADLHEQIASDLAVREGTLRAAREEARLIEKGARPEQITAARAEVERLEAEAADIERRRAACDLRAPVSGTVITPELEQRRGERVEAGGLLLEIAQARSLFASVRVLETEIGDLQVGQPVRLLLTAFPDRSFAGQIVEIAPAAELDDLGRATFRVRCSVGDPDQLLRPGMTGAAKVSCGGMPLGRLILRRVLRMIDPSLLV